MSESIASSTPWYLILQANFSKIEYDRRKFLESREKQLKRWTNQAHQIIENSDKKFETARQQDGMSINRRILELEREKEILALQLESVAAVINVPERKRLKSDRQLKLVRRELVTKSEIDSIDTPRDGREHLQALAKLFAPEENGPADEFFHTAHTIACLGYQLELQAELIARWQSTAREDVPSLSGSPETLAMELFPGSRFKLTNMGMTLINHDPASDTPVWVHAWSSHPIQPRSITVASSPFPAHAETFDRWDFTSKLDEGIEKIEEMVWLGGYILAWLRADDTFLSPEEISSPQKTAKPNPAADAVSEKSTTLKPFPPSAKRPEAPGMLFGFMFLFCINCLNIHSSILRNFLSYLHASH
jgi:hypothetical protein